MIDNKIKENNGVTVISNYFEYKDGKTYSHSNLMNPTTKQQALYAFN